MSRIGVYSLRSDHTIHGPHYHIKRREAKAWVSAGRAQWLDLFKVAMRRVPQRKKKVDPLACQQASTYELAAMDHHPQFVQGGLTRDEHQPRKIDRYKAARVPH